MSCAGLIVSMGSFQLSQFSVNTHYLALRTTVKKLVVSTAFLFATVTANQAVACDMGAIETWVAAAANGTVARQNQLLKIRLRAVTAAIVPRFIPLGDLN